MTGNSARQLHGYLATLRTMSAANPQAAWGELLQISEPSEVVVAMAQVAGLLDETARSIRAADGIINIGPKLAYLPEWTNPVYGWHWPGNPQTGTRDALTNYPRQDAVNVLDNVADILDRFGQDKGLSGDDRESLLAQLVELRDQVQTRVVDPAVRHFLVSRLLQLIDGITASDVRGSDVFAGTAAAAAAEFQTLSDDERISESDRSWVERAHDVALRAVHLAGLGVTLYLSVQHDPAAAALALAAAKEAIGRVDKKADPGTLERLDTPKGIEAKTTPADQEPNTLNSSSPTT